MGIINIPINRVTQIHHLYKYRVLEKLEAVSIKARGSFHNKFISMVVTVFQLQIPYIPYDRPTKKPRWYVFLQPLLLLLLQPHRVSSRPLPTLRNYNKLTAKAIFATFIYEITSHKLYEIMEITLMVLQSYLMIFSFLLFRNSSQSCKFKLW